MTDFAILPAAPPACSGSTLKLAISPLAGEVAAQQPEGVGEGSVGRERASSTASATPPVGFADTLPAGGREAVAPIAITAEQNSDFAVREALLDRAMGPNRRRKSSEKLRRGRLPAEGLAFVARDADGGVVGTVRLWNVTLGEGGAPALLLGPLAVDPLVKSTGIGSALMRKAVSEAGRLGHGAILLVGDAPYYVRFGFSADKTGSLAMPGPYERERFLAVELVDGALTGAAGTLKASGRKVRNEALPLAA